ncbi:hypothetical protein V8E53_012231 [Lactarius tabidus]
MPCKAFYVLEATITDPTDLQDKPSLHTPNLIEGSVKSRPVPWLTDRVQQHMKCPSTLLLGFTGFKGRADRTSTSFPVPNTFPSLPGPCSFVRLSGEWKRGRNPVGTGRRKAEGIRTSPRFTVHAVSSGDGSLLYREHAYLRKFNYEAKTWNGRSRDQGVSILPLYKYNLCRGWLLPLGGCSRNSADSDDIVSMILRRPHL